MKKNLSDSLRKAIVSSGLSLAEVSTASGVPLTSVRRFVDEGKDVELATAVALAASIGFNIQLASRPRAR